MSFCIISEYMNIFSLMLFISLTHITFRVNSKCSSSSVEMTSQGKFIQSLRINAKVHNYSPCSFVKLSLRTGATGHNVQENEKRMKMESIG